MADAVPTPAPTPVRPRPMAIAAAAVRCFALIINFFLKPGRVTRRTRQDREMPTVYVYIVSLHCSHALDTEYA